MKTYDPLKKTKAYINRADAGWKRFVLKIWFFWAGGMARFFNWKTLFCPLWCLPWSPYIHKRWKTNKKIIELEITEYCNLSCLNCECCFTSAPSGEHITVEQIKKFVHESIKLNWQWEVIKIRGGEPTLHPDFFQIVDSLEGYKKFNPLCKFYLLTNGYSEMTKKILSRVPKWMIIINEGRGTNMLYNGLIHDSINLAPIDLMLYKSADFTKACARTLGCGMALSRYGYYPCAPAIHVSRIFGLDIGIKKLSLLNDESFKKQLIMLCKYCGHYKEPNDAPSKAVISASWEKAFKKFKSEKPKISLY